MKLEKEEDDISMMLYHEILILDKSRLYKWWHTPRRVESINSACREEIISAAEILNEEML